MLRHFGSFSQAAHENAVSRISIGFHFRDAVETGVRHGGRIGEAGAPVRRLMQPVGHTRS